MSDVIDNKPHTRWGYDVLPYTMEEVQDFCVRNEEWQNFRRSLKGVPTIGKLARLEIRRLSKLHPTLGLKRIHQVQIDNYINALKRGGQLDVDCNFVR